MTRIRGWSLLMPSAIAFAPAARSRSALPSTWGADQRVAGAGSQSGRAAADDAVAWLPEKDRPVPAVAIALGCDALVTGDCTHFGTGYGRAFGGVTIHSPRSLAELLLVPG
jgi:hypothetical protein